MPPGVGLRTCPRWFLFVFLPKGTMNISDAFSTPEDAPPETRMTEEEGDQLGEWVAELVEDYRERVKDESQGQLPWTDGDVQVFTQQGFLAGRIYQHDLESSDEVFPINMDRDMLGLFIQFLAERAREAGAL